MICNLQDLAHEVGAAHNASTGATTEETVRSIARRLYKDTDCGIAVSINGTTVSIAGYCEGVDAQPAPHELVYPFSAAQLWDAVSKADRDGVELWNATHGCPDCGGAEIDPDCKTCDGHGTVL